MAAHKTIDLDGLAIRREGHLPADGTPGTLYEATTGSNTERLVLALAGADPTGPLYVLLEQSMSGGDIDDTVAHQTAGSVKNQILVGEVQSGKRIQVRMEAENIAAGALLDVTASGTVTATSTAPRFESVEAVDNSGGSSGSALIAVRAIY